LLYQYCHSYLQDYSAVCYKTHMTELIITILSDMNSPRFSFDENKVREIVNVKYLHATLYLLQVARTVSKEKH
jgi:hypothetical protein